MFQPSDNSKILPPGLTASSSQAVVAKVHTQQAKVSAAATLRDLSSEYFFYTPALLYLHVNLMGREPFQNFLEERKRDVVPLLLAFEQPIFANLANAKDNWNNVLLGMEHEPFTEFVQWLGTLAFSDPGRQQLARLRYRQISIIDPIYLQKAAIIADNPPRVDVLAFCLDTNVGCYYIADPVDRFQLPTATYIPGSYDDTMAFARALYTEHNDPYAFVAKQQQVGNMSIEEIELRHRVHAARTKETPS